MMRVERWLTIQRGINALGISRSSSIRERHSEYPILAPIGYPAEQRSLNRRYDLPRASRILVRLPVPGIRLAVTASPRTTRAIYAMSGNPGVATGPAQVR